jgi:hypothetical protein
MPRVRAGRSPACRCGELAGLALQSAGCPARGARRARHRVLSHEKVVEARLGGWSMVGFVASRTTAVQYNAPTAASMSLATTTPRRGGSRAEHPRHGLHSSRKQPQRRRLAASHAAARAASPVRVRLSARSEWMSRVGDGFQALRRQIDQYKPASLFGLFCRRSKTNNDFPCGLVSFRWKKRQVEWVLPGKTNGVLLFGCSIQIQNTKRRRARCPPDLTDLCFSLWVRRLGTRPSPPCIPRCIL